MLRAITLKTLPDYDLRCCWASLGLCVYGGQKWTPEKAINYIFQEYTLPQERMSMVEIQEVRRLHEDEGMSFPEIGRLFGRSYQAMFRAYNKFYRTGGDSN